MTEKNNLYEDKLNMNIVKYLEYLTIEKICYYFETC